MKLNQRKKKSQPLYTRSQYTWTICIDIGPAESCKISSQLDWVTEMSLRNDYRKTDQS